MSVVSQDGGELCAKAATWRVVYSRPMVREAVRSYVVRRLIGEQKAVWIGAALTVAALAYLLWRGERDWLVGVIAMLAVLPWLFLLAGWRAHHVNSVGRFDAMRSPAADFAFDDDGITVTSDLGSARLPWSSLTELWERQGYWMLFSAPNQFNILPVDGIAPDVLAFVRSRIGA